MKGKIRYFGSTILLLAALSFTAAACTTLGGNDDDQTVYTRQPASEHQKKHPNGHGGKDGKACFYDRGNDVYFCSFDN